MKVADYEIIEAPPVGDGGGYLRAIPPERLGCGDDEVLLKVLGRRASDDEFKRFTNEMRLLHRAASPYLAELLDAGTFDGDLFMVTRRYDGPLPVATVGADDATTRRVLRVVADGARGADALHELGVAHRNIRPQSLLVDGGSGRLGDLGLAEMGPDASATFGVGPIGTLGYMAPEMIVDGRAGRATDVWSLGAVLHAALSDRALHGEIPTTTMLDALRHLSRTPPVVDDRLDDSIVAAIRRCLSAPEDRFTTAGDLATELDRIAESFRGGTT